MNEVLQNQLAEALRGLIETSAQAKDFVLAELPDVITQLLWWHGVYNFLVMCGGILIIYACYKVCAIYINYLKKAEGDRFELIDHPEIMLSIFLIFPIIFGVCLLNLTWMQILVAPKIFLIEYAAQFVK